MGTNEFDSSFHLHYQPELIISLFKDILATFLNKSYNDILMVEFIIEFRMACANSKIVMCTWAPRTSYYFSAYVTDKWFYKKGA